MLIIREITYIALASIIIEKYEPVHVFNVGDHTMWESCGTIKYGEVMAVIPPGEFPPVMEELPGFTFRSFGGGGARNEVSYLIARDLKGNEKVRRLYWPCTKWLVKIENGTK